MKNSRDMKRHIMAHTGEKPFGCEFCDYKCNQKVQLKGHMIRNHWIFSKMKNHLDHSESKTSFEYRHTTLQNYQKTKYFWTIFSCSFVLIILQNGPINLGGQYGCPFCEKIQNSKGDMNRHIKTHTGEKPYLCDFCNYKSNQITNLKRHMERKHDKTFSLVKNVQFANL